MNTIKRNIANINTDIDNYNKYKNILSWKGIVDNKNIFSVDQTSFYDAKNVYVDDDYQLSSRKPLRDISSLLYDKSVSFNSPISSGYKLKELMSLNGSKLYIGYTEYNDKVLYEISFFKPNSSNGFYYKKISDIENYHISSIGPYIICFNEIEAKVLNTADKNSDWESLKSYAYTPIYKTVIGNSIQLLEKNLLTTSYREQYIYSNNSKTIFPATGGFEEDGILKSRQLTRLNLSTTSEDYYYETDTNNIEYKLPRKLNIDISNINISDIYANDNVVVIDKKTYALLSLDGGDTFSNIIYPNYDMSSNFYMAGLSDDKDYFFIVVRSSIYRLNIPDLDWTIINYENPISSDVNVINNSCHFSTGDIFGFLAYDNSFKILAYILGPDIDTSKVRSINTGAIFTSSEIDSIKSDFSKYGRYYVRSIFCTNILEYNIDVTYFLAIIENSSNTKMLIIDKDGQVIYEPISFGSRFVSCGYGDYIYFTLSDSGYNLIDQYGYVTLYDYSTYFTVITPTPVKFRIYINTPNISDGRIFNFGNIRVNDYSIIDGTTVSIIDQNNKIYFKNAIGIYTLPDNFTIDSIDSNIISNFSRNGIWYGLINNYLYSNVLFDSDKIIADYEVTDDIKYDYIPNCSYSDSELYFSIDNELFITTNTYENNKLMIAAYSINNQKFSSIIKSIINISTSEIALFFEDGIVILYKVEDETFGYRYEYKKTRLLLGIDYFNSPINTIEGSYTLFPTRRGLASMTYQEFMSTSDQIANYITATIESLWTKFYDSNNNIRILQHKSYIIIYNYTNTILIFDTRNSSWWKWELPINVLGMYSDQISLQIISSGLYDFYDNNRYLDLFGTANKNIDWYFVTQPLHLDAPNYYKNLRQLIFHLADDNDNKKTVSVQVRLYRDKFTFRSPDSVEFKIDNIGSIVKRFNYWKINLLQLAISSDNDNAIKYRLQLHGLGIKYEVGYEIK